ncbi:MULTISPECIES: hypothetical protein [Microbacterium]|uniref:Uncharacterized protein n=1 Tax=Microbacterium trichothecenolyticum TaxID=69370 RepID=A0A0M2HC10_MICTR|nr:MULTISPECIES: hypothetical protein [Microbacterium]KJL41643.1 hypothetical protein RS82_02873 [Microbacterium trichothecenolyticum]
MATISTPVANAGKKPRRGGARRITRALSGQSLGLFAETIVVSLAVALLALPGVTALPAMAAGAAHLRRHVEGETDSLFALVRDFWRALRGGWAWGVLSAAGFAAITITLTSPMTADMPGGEVFRWVSVAFGAVAAVVLLRATTAWQPDSRWSVLVRTAAESAARDVRGSLLLVLALGLSFLIVWMFAPLVVLVPGLLVLAARAVEMRTR